MLCFFQSFAGLGTSGKCFQRRIVILVTFFIQLLQTRFSVTILRSLLYIICKLLCMSYRQISVLSRLIELSRN